MRIMAQSKQYDFLRTIIREKYHILQQSCSILLLSYFVRSMNKSVESGNVICEFNKSTDIKSVNYTATFIKQILLPALLLSKGFYDFS